MGHLIQIKDIQKKYGKNILFKALSLEILENEILVVFGASGVGKSSLLNILGQLDQGYEGTIIYDQAIYQAHAPLPMVFQSAQLFPWLTSEQNILLGGKDPVYFSEISRDLEIDHVMDLYPNQLSGGLQQRVAIARALMCQSKIVLMDEPFSSLDFEIRQKLQALIIHLKTHYGKTIVFITHDVDEALTIGDRMLILKSGSYELIDDLNKQTNESIKNKVST